MSGPTTHQLVGYVDSVDTAGRVRVAATLAGIPGPWEPIATYGYPFGAYPGMPVVAMASPIPSGWHPGFVYSPPNPKPPTERLPEPTPRSEWCCGGTCLRELCDYHRDE